MKKHILTYLCLSLVLLLGACGPSMDTEPEAESSYLQEEQYAESIPAETDAEDIVASEEGEELPPAEGLVHSKLTNEWIPKETARLRPIAVMIPNEYKAIPQYGLSEASVLYEANVEGRMTRLMAIFEDWKGLSKIGNVRSLRSYYVYWAYEWDAVILHAGQPFFVNDLLDQPDTETISEAKFPDSLAFFQDLSRSRPHNVYTDGNSIQSVMQRKSYSLSYHDYAEENHFSFASASNPNTLSQYADAAVPASYIDLSSCYPLTRCYFEYNDADGLYYRYQHLSSGSDGPHIDGANGEQLKFKNILIQKIHQEDLGGGYLVFQCHDDTQDGWFFTNGKGIHVTWKKTADFSATRFYDDNGEEVLLNTGKTMICVVNENDSISYR